MNTNSNEGMISEKRKFQIEEGILIFLLLLSLIGIGITHFSPADGYWYWIIMIFVFAIFAIAIGWLQSKQKDISFNKLLFEQAFHWGSCMLVVGAMFTLLHSDHLTSHNTGLIILLILSLATFLDGQRVGWRFSLVGLFLGISSIIVSHFNHFMWLEIVLVILIVYGTIMWESKWHKYLEQKEEQE